jgi:hypothetical protein
MTISKNAAKCGLDASICPWPILQGHLNIREIYLANDKAVDSFRNLSDIIDYSFIEKHAVSSIEKRYFIFFKGKMYKFKFFDNCE